MIHFTAWAKKNAFRRDITRRTSVFIGGRDEILARERITNRSFQAASARVFTVFVNDGVFQMLTGHLGTTSVQLYVQDTFSLESIVFKGSRTGRKEAKQQRESMAAHWYQLLPPWEKCTLAASRFIGLAQEGRHYGCDAGPLALSLPLSLFLSIEALLNALQPRRIHRRLARSKVQSEKWCSYFFFFFVFWEDVFKHKDFWQS